MSEGRAPGAWAVAFLVLLTVSTAGINLTYHKAVIEKIERQERRRMMTTEWTSGGKKRTWTSTLQEHDPDEEFGDFLDRHERELVLAMAKYPEDPTPPE